MTIEHDFKEKPKHRTKMSAIDFVISLQLELCLHRIEITPPQPDLQIIVKNDSDKQKVDEAELIVLFRPQDANQLQALGKLRRWEGTSTRFEGQFLAPAWHPGILILLMLITLIYPIPACLLSYLLFSPTLAAMASPGACLFLLLAWGLPYILLLSLLSRWSDYLIYLEFREAIEAHLRVKRKS